MFESSVTTMFQTNICLFIPYITFQCCPCTFTLVNIFKAVFLMILYLEHYKHNGKSIEATLETYVPLEVSNTRICLKHSMY